jgi:hypothetical protein
MRVYFGIKGKNTDDVLFTFFMLDKWNEMEHDIDSARLFLKYVSFSLTNHEAVYISTDKMKPVINNLIGSLVIV